MKLTPRGEAQHGLMGRFDQGGEGWLRSTARCGARRRGFDVCGTCQGGRIAYQPLTAQADHQDFLGVLFGDCTGNWGPPSGGAAGSIEAWMPDRPAVRVGPLRQGRSGTIAVPIYANATNPIQALDVTLAYDATDLHPIRVRRTPQGVWVAIAVNATEPGRLRVVPASAQPITVDDRPLLVAEFAGTPLRGTVRLVEGEVYSPEW